MFGVVLSVLLMGMLPMAGVLAPDQAVLQNLSVSAPLPLSGSSSTLLLGLSRRVTASGAVVFDLQSGQTLFARRADEPRPMASLTKLMTALIIAENHDVAEVVTVPEAAGAAAGSTAKLAAGERYTVGALLTALLVASANDAATTLALFHSGSEEAFVNSMNERARMLGLQGTSFANVAGFDDPEQYATPRDLAWLASFVLRKTELRDRLSLPSASIRSREGRVLQLQNTHELLGGGGVLAGKTGTTGAAGQCLISLVSSGGPARTYVGTGGREYVVVLLGSRARYADMRAILQTLPSLFL